MAPPARYFDAAATAESSRGDVSVASQSTVLAGLDNTADMTAESSTSNGRRAFVSKRLRPQAGPARPQATLFVSSLPFTATSTDLTTLFSDIGPLRRAFVVTDKESGKSKGVGYVTYAVREDAERALQEMQGKSLDGGKRRMRIEWAERGANGEGASAGPTENGKSSRSVSAVSRPAATSSSSDKDPDAVRTIIVVGLAGCSPAADSKSLYKRTRKIGDVDNVIYPAPSSATSTNLSNDVAHVVYRTPNHAMTAVTKLHAHVFKNAQLSVVLKKRADGAARLDAHMRPETKAKRDEVRKKLEREQEQAKADKLVRDAQNSTASTSQVKAAPIADVNRGSRLIVRNLPFDVTDRDLRAVFLPYGPIYSIDVPQKQTVADKKKQEKSADDDGDAGKDAEGDVTMAAQNDEGAGASAGGSKSAQGKGRGFAFVWLVSRADCSSNAIQGVNGTELQHGAAEKAQLKSAKGKAGREAAKAALEAVSATAQPARQVAVDWALSKKDFEQRKEESEAEDTAAEEEADSSDDDDEDDDSEDSDSDLDPIAMEDADNESKATSAEDEGDDAEAKPALPQPEEGTTLFIRNLPYQSTEEELRNLFRTFGPLRYAKVTMDKATKRPKGTAFVCFWQVESADKALQQAQLVESASGANAISSTKKNPFSASSVLTADPSAPLTMSLNLHGRVLSVVPALARGQADDLANASANAREKRDKRNTYLIREGVPLPGTTLATQLKEVEIERRLANFQVRKAQMTKNPSLFMSKTRLSVRQLPLYVTDKLLKRLAGHAVDAFDAEVASGTRQGLTDDEIRSSRELATTSAHDEDAGDDSDEEDDMTKKQILRKKRKDALQRRRTSGKGGLCVVQSKVVRQKDRLDPVTGTGRSRGYGFLEMATFADTLKVVRWANANAGLRKLLTKWYADELGSISKGIKASLKADGGDTNTSSKTDAGPSQQQTDAARLKAIEQKKQQLDAGGRIDAEEEGTRGGLLIVEFSVENIVVVKRRAERGEVIAKRQARRSEAAASGASEGRFGSKRKREDERDSDRRVSTKKARPATWNQKTPKKGRNTATGAASAGGANALPLGTKRADKPTTTPSAAVEKQGTAVGSMIGRKRKQRKGKA